jgi:hypothetical protein
MIRFLSLTDDIFAAISNIDLIDQLCMIIT